MEARLLIDHQAMYQIVSAAKNQPAHNAKMPRLKQQAMLLILRRDSTCERSRWFLQIHIEPRVCPPKRKPSHTAVGECTVLFQKAITS